jgi:hypothetical protein
MNPCLEIEQTHNSGVIGAAHVGIYVPNKKSRVGVGHTLQVHPPAAATRTLRSKTFAILLGILRGPVGADFCDPNIRHGPQVDSSSQPASLSSDRSDERVRLFVCFPFHRYHRNKE